MRRTGLVGICVALVALCLVPAAASAQTYSFINTDDLGPTGGAGDFGRAQKYPSTIGVGGIAGTVTNVRLTIFGYRSARGQDTDILLVGPNGQNVLLLADACGTSSFMNNNWTFDDSAPTFVSAAGCGNFEQKSYKPSGYLGDDQADMTQFPGTGPAGATAPPPPYNNALRFLTGGSANGSWNLFVLDDTSGFNSFDIAGWALTLDVQPPPSSGGGTSGGNGGKHTGKRARAIKKCKKKKHRKARRRCIKRAKKLPK